MSQTRATGQGNALPVILKCFGYMGFGGGFEMVRRKRRLKRAKKRVDPKQQLFCNICPHAQSCFERHRARVADLFPESWKVLVGIMAELGDDKPKEIIAAWQEGIGGGPNEMPPDIVLQLANVEDGQSVANGQETTDRGAGTLTWPLVPLTPMVGKCTPLASSWCAVHGLCSCARGAGSEGHDPECPLHGLDSAHAVEA